MTHHKVAVFIQTPIRPAGYESRLRLSTSTSTSTKNAGSSYSYRRRSLETKYSIPLAFSAFGNPSTKMVASYLVHSTITWTHSNENPRIDSWSWHRLVVGLVVIRCDGGDIIGIGRDPETLTVRREERILVVYNKQSPTVPEGIDPIYRRSGFLHPVNTLAGRTMTDTFPRDHAHQHGIFSAWVSTTYGERTIDFWNLAGRTGRVEHERVAEKFESDQGTGFEVDMIHRAEEAPAIDILRERWKVTVYPPVERGYSFDLESSQQALTNIPLVVNQYHYGGMACEATRAGYGRPPRTVTRLAT